MTRLKMVCTCEEDQITNLHGIDVGLNLVYDLQRRAYEVESSGDGEGKATLLGCNSHTASARSPDLHIDRMTTHLTCHRQNANTSHFLAASVPSVLSPSDSAAVKGISPKFIDQASLHLVTKACCMRKETSISPPRCRLMLTNTHASMPHVLLYSWPNKKGGPF